MTTEDPYAPIADLYDFSYADFTEDVEFYENVARAIDGPLLELGVGSGRVAIPLAQAGYDVVGIDNSPSMLAAARQRLEALGPTDGSLDLIEGDMTAFELEQRFGMVLVAANTFQHLLTTKEQLACVRSAVKCLQPDGIFSMSVRSPSTVTWDDTDGWSPMLMHWTRRDEATGELVMKFCVEQPDPARMVRRLTYIYDRVQPQGDVKRSVFTTELRYSTEAEIRLLLQQCGLRVTHVYGDYDLSPVGIGENLVFVARAENAG
jgi:SAM-dependent methyltransferase